MVYKNIHQEKDVMMKQFFFVSLSRNYHWKWTQKYNQYSHCHCKRQIDKHFPWLILLVPAARGSA